MDVGLRWSLEWCWDSCQIKQWDCQLVFGRVLEKAIESITYFTAWCSQGALALAEDQTSPIRAAGLLKGTSALFNVGTKESVSCAPTQLVFLSGHGNSKAFVLVRHILVVYITKMTVQSVAEAPEVLCYFALVICLNSLCWCQIHQIVNSHLVFWSFSFIKIKLIKILAKHFR